MCLCLGRVFLEGISQGGKISPECGQYLPKGWDEREKRGYLSFSIIFFRFLFTVVFYHVLPWHDRLISLKS